eukprot:scaffold120550_cov28-Tisochrysis_lutea.AAC.7
MATAGMHRRVDSEPRHAELMRKKIAGRALQADVPREKMPNARSRSYPTHHASGRETDRRTLRQPSRRRAARPLARGRRRPRPAPSRRRGLR